MATTTLPPGGPPAPTTSKEQQPYVELGRKRHTGWKLLGVLVFWLVCWWMYRRKIFLRI